MGFDPSSRDIRCDRLRRRRRPDQLLEQGRGADFRLRRIRSYREDSRHHHSGKSEEASLVWLRGNGAYREDALWRRRLARGPGIAEGRRTHFSGVHHSPISGPARSDSWNCGDLARCHQAVRRNEGPAQGSHSSSGIWITKRHSAADLHHLRSTSSTSTSPNRSDLASPRRKRLRHGIRTSPSALCKIST
jgi:hypothetical protein